MNYSEARLVRMSKILIWRVVKVSGREFGAGAMLKFMLTFEQL